MRKKLFTGLYLTGLIFSLIGCAPSHVHDLYKVLRVEPTCVNEGVKEYYKCANETCGKIFSDREAKDEVTLDELVIPATGIHTGGQATCNQKAICDVCGQEYGELGTHLYNQEVVDAKYLYAEATCDKSAIYYKSCACGEKGEETFNYGEPLGHDYKEYNGLDNLQCTRCNMFKQILDFENAKSNAWNEVGAEYPDMLWKITGQKEGMHGEFVVARLNQAIEEEHLNGKIYLEFEVTATKNVTAKLSLAALLGVAEVNKDVFKLTVNNIDVPLSGKLVSQYADYNHVELNDFANIDLVPGYNFIRFTIMDSPKCDIDYIVLEANECVNEHNFIYDYDDAEHWLKCTDDNCQVIISKEKHNYNQEIKDNKYLAKEADCTHNPVYYKSCKCGKAGTETFGGEETSNNHNFNQEVVDDKYLAKPATCLEAAQYYKSCVCGEKGEETFNYGEPLGHDYQAIGSDINNLKCSRCDTYQHIQEFENMRSNAWNEDGAEYRDQLWKTAGENYHGGMCVKRINDCGIENPGKIYFEFDVMVLEDVSIDLYMNLATGGTEILKSGFGVYINGILVDVGDDKFVSPNNDDWSTETFRNYYYSTITLKAGINLVRLVINQGCSCNADFLYFEGETLVNEHNLILSHDENGHWYQCSDEGCNEKTLIMNHVFDQKIIDEKYASDDGKYYYSCICGQIGTEKFNPEAHVHNLVQQETGKNDVLVCDCGMMKRKFDLATSYSESWSEGTVKSDQLWRIMGTGASSLDSGNYVGHIGDSVNDGTHDNEYWIEIAVTIESEVDIEAELILNAGVGGGDWNNLTLQVNGEEIKPAGTIVGNGWTEFTDYSAGMITLKAGQINVIHISPKFGCLMNWAYLQINSECMTNNVTSTLENI